MMKKYLNFLLVKLPLILWIVISLILICFDSARGIILAIWMGVPVGVWTLFAKWCLKKVNKSNIKISIPESYDNIDNFLKEHATIEQLEKEIDELSEYDE